MNILAFKILTLYWILSHVIDQYNGFVTLKDFELPDDGFDWGAETCWSDWSVINYPELICAFGWFIFVFIIENARSKKQNLLKLQISYFFCETCQNLIFVYNMFIETCEKFIFSIFFSPHLSVVRIVLQTER